MRREWVAGDLGVTAQGRLALRRENHPDGWIDSQGAPWSNEKFPTNVRPLIVIDPEDREQVERVTAAVKSHRAGLAVSEDTIAAALRSLIAPEKPAEPMGLGAVVEDANCLRWVRRHPGGAAWVNGYQRWAEWSEIKAVRVLNAGVTP